MAVRNGCGTQWMNKAGGLRQFRLTTALRGHGKNPRSGNAGEKPNKKPARTEQNDKCVFVMSESECEYAQVESQSHRGGWRHWAMREEARCRAGRRVRT